jgi:hypothetical protein
MIELWLKSRNTSGQRSSSVLHRSHQFLTRKVIRVMSDLSTSSSQPPDETEPYIKLEQEAVFLNVKGRTIHDWLIRFPDLPRPRLPGSIRVRHSEVLKWLKQFNDGTPTARSKGVTPDRE